MERRAELLVEAVVVVGLALGAHEVEKCTTANGDGCWRGEYMPASWGLGLVDSLLYNYVFSSGIGMLVDVYFLYSARCAVRVEACCGFAFC